MGLKFIYELSMEVIIKRCNNFAKIIKRFKIKEFQKNTVKRRDYRKLYKQIAIKQRKYTIKLSRLRTTNNIELGIE